MYTVVKSIAINKTPNSRWQEVNLAAVAVHEIFSIYRKIYLELTAGFLVENIFVDMDSLRIKYGYFQGTLSDLFLDNGSATLETIDSIPSLENKKAYFSDAILAGYKLDMVDSQPYNAANKLDLKLSRKDVDIQDVYKHCLFTVNGFFHMSDMDPQFIYLNHGGNTMLKSRDNHVGIWSWANLGEINQIKITPQMLFNQHESSVLIDKTYIKINENIGNKTPLLILGGYLVLPEKDVFFKTSEDTFCLNLSRIPLLRRYFESRNFIDYSFMEFDQSSINDSLINIEEFYSDSKITKYLTLPQSFIVLVDAEDVYFERHFIKHTKMPGMLISYIDPVFPLFNGAGKSSEYWKTYEDSMWSLTVADNYRQNKVFESALAGHLTNVGDSNQTTSTHFNSQAYLLEAGTDN